MHTALDNNLLMAFMIPDPIKTLPVPAKCHDIPFEVDLDGKVVATSDNLFHMRQARLTPIDREARLLVGGPPSGSTEAEDANAHTRRTLSPLYGHANRKRITAMFQMLLNPSGTPTGERDANVAGRGRDIPPGTDIAAELPGL